MKKTTPENLVLNAVCEYLLLKRYFFFRCNNTPIFDPVRRVMRKLPKYAIKGVSDLIMLKGGVVYFIECKAPKGVQSLEQKLFQSLIERHGGKYLLVREVGDIIRAGL